MSAREMSAEKVNTAEDSSPKNLEVAVIASLTVWTSVMKTARVVPPRMPGLRMM